MGFWYTHFFSFARYFLVVVLPAVYKHFCFVTISLMLDIIQLLNLSHLCGCRMVSHCGFYLHFPIFFFNDLLCVFKCLPALFLLLWMNYSYILPIFYSLVGLLLIIGISKNKCGFVYFLQFFAYFFAVYLLSVFATCILNLLLGK